MFSALTLMFSSLANFIQVYYSLSHMSTLACVLLVSAGYSITKVMVGLQTKARNVKSKKTEHVTKPQIRMSAYVDVISVSSAAILEQVQAVISQL